MNPRFRKALIVIGLVTIIIIAIVLIPRGLSIYFQTKGGQQIEYVLRFEEGIDELVCGQLPTSDAEAFREVEGAITNLNRAIRLNSNNSQAYYYLGKAYCVTGNPEKAVGNYKEYTELRPDNPLGYIGLGFVYEALGEMSSAKLAWTSAGLRAREFNSAGDENFVAKDYDEAITWYERALVIDPKSAESLLNLGKVYESLNENESALEVYSRAWEQDPELSTSELIDVYKRKGDFESIEDILQLMLDNFPISPRRLEWWETLGEIHADNSNWTAAIDVNLKAIDEFPAHKIFHLNLGWAYYESNSGVDKAIEEFTEVINLEPETGVGEFAIARVLAKESRFIDADEYYQLALSLNPDANWWHLERGNASLRAKNYLLAIEIYKNLIERDLNYIPAYFGLAQTYQEASRIEQAVSTIDQVLEFSESIDFHQYMIAGRIYEWAGEFDKALTSYHQAFIKNPTSDLALEAINRIKE